MSCGASLFRSKFHVVGGSINCSFHVGLYFCVGLEAPLKTLHQARKSGGVRFGAESERASDRSIRESSQVDELTLAAAAQLSSCLPFSLTRLLYHASPKTPDRESYVVVIVTGYSLVARRDYRRGVDGQLGQSASHSRRVRASTARTNTTNSTAKEEKEKEWTAAAAVNGARKESFPFQNQSVESHYASWKQSKYGSQQ